MKELKSLCSCERVRIMRGDFEIAPPGAFGQCAQVCRRSPSPVLHSETAFSCRATIQHPQHLIQGLDISLFVCFCISSSLSSTFDSLGPADRS